MDIHEELRVTAYINANEWYTSQGGSMLAAPVAKAMTDASQRAVQLIELQNAVGDAITRLTYNEAARPWLESGYHEVNLVSFTRMDNESLLRPVKWRVAGASWR